MSCKCGMSRENEYEKLGIIREVDEVKFTREDENSHVRRVRDKKIVSFGGVMQSTVRKLIGRIY
jgi:hypothetical protein